MQYIGAYLLQGSPETVDVVRAHLLREGVITEGSSDVYARVYRSFGIDDAQEISARSRSRALSKSGRVFILSMPGMTNEAQNALLKTIEEPAAGARFFFIIPSPETLLPTLRSRMQSMSLPGSFFAESIVPVAAFLSASPEKRLEALKPLYTYDEDEGRDTASIIAFLHEIERVLAVRPQTPQNIEGIRAVYRARKYASDKGSLLKVLLEQVALCV